MVAWADLNIKLQGKENEDVYDHSKAVDLHNKIGDFLQNQQYLPRQLNYEPFDLELPGPFTQDVHNGIFDTVETMVCL
jgi:hypothetical protein